MNEPLVFYTWKPERPKNGVPCPQPILRTQVTWTEERTGEIQNHEWQQFLELRWRYWRWFQRSATACRLDFGFARHGKLYGRIVIDGKSYLRSAEVQRLTPERCRQLIV